MADERRVPGGTLDLFRPPAAHAAPQHGTSSRGRAPEEGDDDGERGAGPPPPRIYSVSDLVRLASRAMEARFSTVWVEGEISNLRATGHLYFTLKDASAQLPAIVWRTTAAALRFRPADGQQVRARGKLTIYETGGRFQLIADLLEPVGLGALQLAFEQLRQKLAAEGLFDDARKRPLPFLPRCIGVVTSPGGAVISDIIRVAHRRGPARILLSPCLVQGEGAAEDIVAALARVQRQPEVDVVIVGRGGGSLEDLQAFNDERVARAIAACRVPVVSAVGHEVDFSIADMVADRRASTPSQAAEILVPERAALDRRLAELSSRLRAAALRRVQLARQDLDARAALLPPLLHRSTSRSGARLAALDRRLAARAPRARLARDRALLDGLGLRLQRVVDDLLSDRGHRAADLDRALLAAMQQALAARRGALDPLRASLAALSPLGVLDRGYALVRRGDGRVVSRAGEVAAGERLTVELADGRLIVSVLAAERKAP